MRGLPLEGSRDLAGQSFRFGPEPTGACVSQRFGPKGSEEEAVAGLPTLGTKS